MTGKVTAIMLAASTVSPYSNPSRFSFAFLVAE
jgi:hypothetical protein